MRKIFMSKGNIFLLLVALILVSSCIKSYIPQIKSKDTNKFVVMGRVDRNDSIQTVKISQTSSISDPHYIPVVGCFVTISDNKNHSFVMYGHGDGTYKGWVDPQYMVPGSKFKVTIVTRDNERLESDYDQMPVVSNIDSVYYQRKQIQGNEPGMITDGIQFYLNMSGNSSDSRLYKYNIYETWEYHTKWPIQWWFDGTIHHEYPPDSSRMVCWRTKKISDVYTLNTNNLTKNAFNQFPINFVSNETSRLTYGYSLLVEQVALSDAAYNFWDRMRLNSSKSGSLYETQPLIVLGNMHDISNPDRDVLGFFSAVSSQRKRIFVKDVPDLPKYYPNYCHITLLRFGLRELMLNPNGYPYYLTGDEKRYGSSVYTSECVDCLLLGGVNKKPDFWPN